MSNTSPLQKSGMQMLLGRERYEALMAEAERVGLSMATVVRHGIDVWMNQPEGDRHYAGENTKMASSGPAPSARPSAAAPSPAASESQRGSLTNAPRGIKPEANPFRPSIPGVEDGDDDEASMGALFRRAMSNRPQD